MGFATTVMSWKILEFSACPHKVGYNYSPNQIEMRPSLSLSVLSLLQRFWSFSQRFSSAAMQVNADTDKAPPATKIFPHHSK
jgi:hypothetical protein